MEEMRNNVLVDKAKTKRHLGALKSR